MNDSVMCSVCYRCKNWECKIKGNNKVCTYDNYNSINSYLKYDIRCYRPVQCGIDLCNIKCYKGDKK